MDSPPAIAPGWYADPQMPGTQRYWDGQNWTPHVAPVAAPLGPAHPPQQNMTGGYVLAFLLPLVGLIYGVVKWKVGGSKVVAASVGAWIVWALLITSLS